MSVGEVACTYAALILHDEDIPITTEKISALLKVAYVVAEPYWPLLFAKLAEKKNLGDLIMNVGAGGGGGAVAVAAPTGGAAGGAAAAALAAEEKKGVRRRNLFQPPSSTFAPSAEAASQPSLPPSLTFVPPPAVIFFHTKDEIFYDFGSDLYLSNTGLFPIKNPRANQLKTSAGAKKNDIAEWNQKEKTSCSFVGIGAIPLLKTFTRLCWQ